MKTTTHQDDFVEAAFEQICMELLCSLAIRTGLCEPVYKSHMSSEIA